MVVHYASSGMRVRCGWSNACRDSDDWNLITCKRCLALRNESDIAARPQLFEATMTTTQVVWVMAGTEAEAKMRLESGDWVLRDKKTDLVQLGVVHS